MGTTGIATALRPAWDDLPLSVRTPVEARLAAPVVAAYTQTGGYTHGVASRLVLADGTRVFAKAIAVGDSLEGAYRTEAAVSTGLPAATPAPRLRFDLQADGWLVLVFDDVAGRHPDLADPADLRLVLATASHLADLLTPNPLPHTPSLGHAYGAAFGVWRGYRNHQPPADLDDWALRNLARLADLEQDWVRATAGPTLLHLDLRPDNLLVTPDGSCFVVDWSAPCVGAAWVDLVGMLPSAARAGVDVRHFAATHPLTVTVDPHDIDAFICALAGFWTRRCRQPPPPRSPHLRAHQAASAATSLQWLAARTAWR